MAWFSLTRCEGFICSPMRKQSLGEGDSQGTQTCHPHHAHEQTRPGMEEHGHRDHLLACKMQQSGENQQSYDFITADLSWWTGQEVEQVEQQIPNKGLPKGNVVPNRPESEVIVQTITDHSNTGEQDCREQHSEIFRTQQQGIDKTRRKALDFAPKGPRKHTRHSLEKA